jgi:hypothetical protein
MKKFLIFFVAATTALTSCNDDSTNNPAAGIAFENAGVFHLGETKTIYFSVDGVDPSTVELNNLPSGWTGRVDAASRTIEITCGKSVGVSGKFRIPVRAGDYLTELQVESDISLLTPFYIEDEPVGIIVREKTPYADGMIMYKRVGDGNWSEIKNWATGVSPAGMWHMPSVDELKVVYTAYNGDSSETPNQVARDRFDNALTSIGGDTIGANYSGYWSSNDDFYGDPSIGYIVWFKGDGAGQHGESQRKSSSASGMAITMF